MVFPRLDGLNLNLNLSLVLDLEVSSPPQAPMLIGMVSGADTRPRQERIGLFVGQAGRQRGAKG